MITEQNKNELRSYLISQLNKNRAGDLFSDNNLFFSLFLQGSYQVGEQVMDKLYNQLRELEYSQLITQGNNND